MDLFVPTPYHVAHLESLTGMDAYRWSVFEQALSFLLFVAQHRQVFLQFALVG